MNMRITITGPRSIGKSTISKLVAKKLKLKYISSDEIGEKALKKEGGLDKAIKSGAIKEFIKKGAYNLIREVYEKEKSFVFDLSGGSVSSITYAEASQKVRETAKKNSIIVGLLPFKDIEKSIKFLFEREKERAHFRSMEKEELFEKVDDNYRRFPSIFKEICNVIIYTENKAPNEVAGEIIKELNVV